MLAKHHYGRTGYRASFGLSDRKVSLEMHDTEKPRSRIFDFKRRQLKARTQVDLNINSIYFLQLETTCALFVGHEWWSSPFRKVAVNSLEAQRLNKYKQGDISLWSADGAWHNGMYIHHSPTNDLTMRRTLFGKGYTFELTCKTQASKANNIRNHNKFGGAAVSSRVSSHGLDI